MNSPSVVPLRRADNIVQMVRDLADRIERGEIKAEEVICLIRVGSSILDMWAWGDYRGEIMTIGMLESAKKLVKVQKQPE